MSMNDRELLELAAKAAGIGTIVGFAGGSLAGGSLVIGPNSRKRYWNSLGDDGDCARLEVVCSINIEWQRIGVVAYAQDGPRVREAYADHPGEDAARRYASTCAAAEIGRSMPD